MSLRTLCGFLLLMSPGISLAQNPNEPVYRPRGTIPAVGEIARNIHGSYSVSYMGPRINGTPLETYNIYLNDIASVQLFHSLQLGYQVSDDLQLGFGGDASQDLVDGVTGLNGTVSERNTTWFDPYVFFQFPRLFQVSGWSVFHAASFSLPVAKPSLDAGKITSITLRQGWSKRAVEPWRFNFLIYLNPQLYSEPLPGGFTDRQTLYAAFGPGIGYELTRELCLSIQSNLTVEHRSPAPRGWASLGESIPDTLRTSLTWTSDLHPVYASIGTYLQSVLWSPSFDTSIVGASFSLGF